MEDTIKSILSGIKRGMIIQAIKAGHWSNRQIIFTRNDARHAALLLVQEPGRYQIVRNPIRIRNGAL